MTVCETENLLHPADTGGTGWRLYLDVDGPLNVFGARPNNRFPAWDDIEPVVRAGMTLRYSYTMGDHLWELCDRLGIEIVWASTWCHYDINELIGSLYGWPKFRKLPYTVTSPSGCGKLAEVSEDACGAHGVVWVDDDLWGPDLEWVHARNEAGLPALALTPSPATGLAPWDLRTIEEFVKENKHVDVG